MNYLSSSYLKFVPFHAFRFGSKVIGLQCVVYREVERKKGYINATHLAIVKV